MSGAQRTPADHATFWGKAKPLDAVQPMHPLVAHSLDVAAVAMLLPHNGLMLDGRVLGWLVSLHDIGKFSRPFQAKAEVHWPTGALGVLDLARKPPPGPRHDALALTLLCDVAADLVALVLSGNGWSGPRRLQLFRALAGHHGRPVGKPDRSEVGPTVLGPGCEAAARAFVEAMAAVFRPPVLPFPQGRLAMERLEWGIAGLVTLADWVGSRQAWFPYVAATSVADPAKYLWTLALPRAASALGEAGLLGARPRRFGGIRELFPVVTTPSPVQDWAEHVALPDGPVLAVVEDLTGSGKTEAAVTLVHRLLATGRAHGMFLALPTTATASAMFDRMATAYRLLFASGTNPSLALAHGRAALDPRFAPALDGGPDPSDRREPDPADQPAESHCAAWLADDRRCALLAQVGVGTIDQALLAVLPVRHAALRQRGLRGKVLVVDEAHAFDPYMREELAALLRFHAAMGGSAILLSATLPQTVRQRLVNAYRTGLGAGFVGLKSTAYPLATLTGALGGATEHPCAPRPGLPRTVAVIRAADVPGVLQRVVEAARAGAAVAWVRNTVDDALAAATLLRAEGITPLVFHARFAFCDRLAIEAEVLRRFGRLSEGDVRACVLVATQVVESSLDLDFDLLCTDLAPVDSLIQRAGRLWRHERVRVLARPELVVLSPDPVPDPAADWVERVLPGTAAVYRDPALLWRGARAFFARGALVTPDDMRPLIEAAAGGEVPPGLAAKSYRAMGKDAAAGGIGRQNVLKFADGYTPEAGSWEPDTHTPTRLEDDPQVILRLARQDGDRIVPYAQVTGSRSLADLRRAWSMSEVSVPRRRLASCPLPSGSQLAGNTARNTWGRWERESEQFVLGLLDVMKEDATFVLAGQDGNGKPVQACYMPQEGLCWTDKTGRSTF